ncbi:MAG: 4Fe-4S binding protein [Planctomycetota bacterium]|nr:4Fe-4S binding protein [Planctomycetota bacterium]
MTEPSGPRKGVKIDDKSLHEMLKRLLSPGGAASQPATVDAVAVQQRTGGAIGYTLVSAPEKLSAPAPFAPAYGMNAASYLRRWLVKGKRIAAVLRPCEQRAVVELMKLEQIGRDSLLIFTTDCSGAYKNDIYAENATAIGQGFHALPGPAHARETATAQKIAELKAKSIALRPACEICDRKMAEGGDVLLAYHGLDELTALPMTAAGEAALASVAEPANVDVAGRRNAARQRLLDQVKTARAEWTAAADRLQNPAALLDFFKNCIACKNCREMCPVCYCQECFFDKDVGCPRGVDLLNVTAVKGAVKLPLYALFFQLTRMYHVSQTCVACGACADACPKNIPLTVVFPFAARKVQETFGYEAGRSIDEPLPWKIFKHEELEPR